MSESIHKVRVLTVTDLHQSIRFVGDLSAAIAQFKPDVLAFIGDFLDLGRPLSTQFTVAQTARALSNLSVAPIIFIRGNHEEIAWKAFVQAWPIEKRPLIALQGTAFQFGPLVIIGFPCRISYETAWLQLLPISGNSLTGKNAASGRASLSDNSDDWLQPLFEQYGPAARTLWLMHEPPPAEHIADFNTSNSEWPKAVKKYSPFLTISGHDHFLPIKIKVVCAN